MVAVGRVSRVTNNGLWLANVATGAKRRLTRHVPEKPAWSPDGTVIAGAWRRRVALVRASDGKLIARLRESSTDFGGPAWTRSGLVILVHAGGCGIDVARADGTRVRRLTRVC